ncbi:hypothetical protein WSM22_21860 [Cytophagales bacterium WSM2-2]|nr:hypothetical protein WSM22_21860 [Cytophagales bacterium WSM2-2]
MKKIFILFLLITTFHLSAQDKKPDPVIVLDGKIVRGLNSINPNNIESVQILYGKDAVDKYGDTARNGVIVVTSKPKPGIPPRESLDPTVTEVWDLAPMVVTPGKNVGDAPSDAILLFVGTDLTEWTNSSGAVAAWDVKDGAMTVAKGAGGIKTKRTFGDIQLHIEWRAPAEVKGDGQGRGNSGIFFHEQYELQVLDSYENQTYSNGQAGSIYKQSIPLVNVCKKPGEWQAYDVVFIAPRFSETTGRIIAPANITVFQNGVLIQNHVEITGPSQYKGLPVYKLHGKGSISLQDHGNPVSYRNIWVREL